METRALYPAAPGAVSPCRASGPPGAGLHDFISKLRSWTNVLLKNLGGPDLPDKRTRHTKVSSRDYRGVSFLTTRLSITLEAASDLRVSPTCHHSFAQLMAPTWRFPRSARNAWGGFRGCALLEDSTQCVSGGMPCEENFGVMRDVGHQARCRSGTSRTAWEGKAVGLRGAARAPWPRSTRRAAPSSSPSPSAGPLRPPGLSEDSNSFWRVFSPLS